MVLDKKKYSMNKIVNRLLEFYDTKHPIADWTNDNWKLENIET